MTMQTISWLGFGSSHALAQTIVHFFPSSGNVTAPYPVLCRMTIFGNTTSSAPVTLDGPRLSHPDGVKMNDLFPVLRQGDPGLYGIEVSISTTQPRIDVTSSMCVIELASRALSTRFLPICLGGKSLTRRSLRRDESEELPRSVRDGGLAIEDPCNSCSVVVVNGTDEVVQSRLGLVLASAAVAGSAEVVPVEWQMIDEAPLAPLSVRETPLNLGASRANEQVTQCGFGPCLSAQIVQREPVGFGVGSFMVYRDGVTGVPVSVSAL